jgi:hypothetical protein
VCRYRPWDRLIPVEGVLPTVYRIKKLKKGQVPTRGCIAIIIIIIIIIKHAGKQPIIVSEKRLKFSRSKN